MLIGEEARRLALVSTIYAVLTFVMAYPFSASPASLVLADAPDTHLYIWTLAWDAWAFLHQPILIFDANIYHPYPNTLAYSENLIGSALLAAPLIWLTGDLVLAMNLTALLTCVLCGSGAYFLARRWGMQPPAAFICGIVFAFAPPRFFRMGQLHMTAVQWIPFTLAFVHSYLEHGRRRDLLLAMACFTLQVLSSGHGAAFLAVAIVVLLLWRIACGQPLAWRKWLRDCGAAGAYLMAPSIWLMLPYRAAQTEAGLRREYPAEAMPGLASFLASPSRAHIALQELAFGKTLNDQAIAFLFPGLVVMALAAAALVTYRPSREPLRGSATAFFALLAALSTLMFVTWPFELWRLLYSLPGFNFIRVPSRFILVVMLSLGMLAAVAFDRFTARWQPRSRFAAALALSFLLLAEYSSHPFNGQVFALDIPEADQWLDTQPKPFVVAEVPVPSAGDAGAHERSHTRAMLHATAHWQKTVHGYSGIRPPLHDRLYAAMASFPDARSIQALRGVGVTYVVVHGADYPAGEWTRVERLLPQSEELRLVHSSGSDRVYAITSRASSATPPSP